MLFNSGFFLFIFLPTFLSLYLLAPRPWRNALLLAASLAFYAWSEPIFIFWALASALVDYGLGQAIGAARSPHRRRLLVGIGVVANLALLAWFKYAMFALGVLNGLTAHLGGAAVNVPKIALPVAISFIVFEKITYLVDIARGSGRPAPSLATYLLYVFYFPKLLAGPIIRYCDIEDQLRQRRLSPEAFRAGLVRFVAGLGKKVLIADHVGHYADQVFALSPAQLNCADAWLGMLTFTIQIYFDFSGYSDMAIGLSQALGFTLRENFNNPYLATSFTDFWRRWHISLSTWIREYLYIPLGGNRCSTPRAYLNLCLCFILSGLWHGAAWTFLAWGCFHGLMLMLDRACWLDWQRHLPVACNRLLTLGLVMLSWLLFRAPDLDGARRLLLLLVSPAASGTVNGLWLSPDIVLSMLAGLVLIYRPLLRQRLSLAWLSEAWQPSTELASTLALLFLVIGRMAVSSFNAFLYFRF